MQPEDVLKFWFGEDPAGGSWQQKQSSWFSGGAEFDETVRERFSELHRKASGGGCDDWCGTERGALALILVLDQLSRNIHRGKGEAFANDAAAQEHCKRLLESPGWGDLLCIERAFALMPLMHSEQLADQELGLTEFQKLAEEAETDGMIASMPGYAVRHLELVKRFGRFPHRNEALGRQSTEEELRYMAEGGESFGQAAKSDES